MPMMAMIPMMLMSNIPLFKSPAVIAQLLTCSPEEDGDHNYRDILHHNWHDHHHDNDHNYEDHNMFW